MTSAESQTESFSVLAQQIYERTRDACGPEMVLKIPASLKSPTTRSGLFASLQSTNGHEKLVRAMYKLGGAPVEMDVSNAVSQYLGARWYGLLVLILSILLFVGCICLALTVGQRMRRMFHKCFMCCHSSREGDVDKLLSPQATPENSPSLERLDGGATAENRYLRSMLAQVGRRIRISLVFLCLVWFCSLAVLIGFGIKSAADLNASKNVIKCNMWMEIHGYFNGAQDIKPAKALASDADVTSRGAAEITLGNVIHQSDVGGISIAGEDLLARITTNWLGSQKILAQLDELDSMTSLTPENPIYKNFTEGRRQLEVNLDAKNALIQSRLADVDDIIQRYTQAATLMSKALADYGNIGDWDGGYDFQFALKSVYQSKANIFRNELTSALEVSWTAIDKLIEEYAGQSSPLMKKANHAVLMTKQTILQIDESMKALYDVWHAKSGLLTALVAILITIVSIYMCLGFVTSALTVYLSIGHLRHHEDVAAPEGLKRSESSNESFYRDSRMIWRIAFVLCALSVSFASVSTGVGYLTAVVGSDACQLANTDLLDNGDWSILGNKILNPPLPDTGVPALPEAKANVDMRQVLDVCMKRSGKGTIGVSLGVDAPISEVNDDVEDAIADINLTREGLLMRNSRSQRVKIIGFMMAELLRGWTHKQHSKKNGILGLAPKINVFNGLLELNWDNHTSSTDGRHTMLAFVPTWPSAGDALISRGLLYTLGSLPDAYSMLNDVSDAVFAKNPGRGFPRFCGATARARKLTCSHWTGDEDSRKIIELDSTDVTAAAINAWVGYTSSSKPYGLDTDVPSLGEYYNGIGERTRHLISALAYVERAAQLPAADVGLADSNLECLSPDGTSRTCVFDDARLAAIDELENGLWPVISTTYDSLISSVDDYVDDLVIPSSKSMVAKANDLMALTNCQFQRGVLDYGVITPMCATAFPATAELTVISFVATVVLLALLFLLWAYRPIFDEDSATLKKYFSTSPPTAGFAYKTAGPRPDHESIQVQSGPSIAPVYDPVPGFRYSRLSVATASPGQHRNVAPSTFALERGRPSFQSVTPRALLADNSQSSYYTNVDPLHY